MVRGGAIKRPIPACHARSQQRDRRGHGAHTLLRLAVFLVEARLALRPLLARTSHHRLRTRDRGRHLTHRVRSRITQGCSLPMVGLQGSRA